MRNSVIISTIIHLIVIGVVVVWSLGFHGWPRKIDVYQIQLVSMPPPPPKKVTMEESKPESVPSEKKVPETPLKNPEKVTTKKPETKKEPAEKEEPQKELSSPGSDKQVKVDTKDFPFAYYLNLLRYRIRENWYPPYQETGEERKISVIVGFRVERNGRITQVDIETSSGKFLFDQAAVRAVSTAGPLPPLPDEYSEERLTVHIEFEAVW